MIRFPARLVVDIHPNIFDIYLFVYLFWKTGYNTIFLYHIEQVVPNMRVCSYLYILTDLFL
jgi:hypothetical protein